jgi:uncharacterized membrane protein YhaH (DUF805 family)
MNVEKESGMVDFNGRVGRGFFVLYFLIFETLLWALAIVQFSGAVKSGFLNALIVLAAFLLQYPQVATSVRRCHDLGKSGVLVWWYLTPLSRYVLFIYLALSKGQSQPNKYGDEATSRLFGSKGIEASTSKKVSIQQASVASLETSTGSPLSMTPASITKETEVLPRSSAGSGHDAVVARLSQLKDLHDRGLITSAVYSEAQKEALNLG